jgi:excisionase family DNA binding protein
MMTVQTTTPNSSPALLLTPRQAAKALSISERTLWAITAPRGPMPAVRIGRAVRYLVSDLQEWIESQKQKGGAA